MTKHVKPGDFTGLARDYAQYRPDYSREVLSALIGLFERETAKLDVVDVGAGTGIWTRMISERHVKSITAVEPNQDMIDQGRKTNSDLSINWIQGGAEALNLPDNSTDWVTMASSFHWADFNQATREFHRILRPGGRFTALWNPRLIEANPLLVKIESHLESLRPGMKRVSSGRSGITSTLTERLEESQFFCDVVYIEGRHIIDMSVDRYLGAWRSVNDLQAQLGANKFSDFISYVEACVAGLSSIKATYLTRAWSARVLK